MVVHAVAIVVTVVVTLAPLLPQPCASRVTQRERGETPSSAQQPGEAGCGEVLALDRVQLQRQ